MRQLQAKEHHDHRYGEYQHNVLESYLHTVALYDPVVKQYRQRDGCERAGHHYSHIDAGRGEELVDAAEEKLQTDVHNEQHAEPIDEGTILTGDGERTAERNALRFGAGLRGVLFEGRILLNHKERYEHRKHEGQEHERNDADIRTHPDEYGDQRIAQYEVNDVAYRLDVGKEYSVALVIEYLGKGAVISQHGQRIGSVEQAKNNGEPDRIGKARFAP